MHSLHPLPLHNHILLVPLPLLLFFLLVLLQIELFCFFPSFHLFPRPLPHLRHCRIVEAVIRAVGLKFPNFYILISIFHLPGGYLCFFLVVDDEVGFFKMLAFIVDCNCCGGICGPIWPPILIEENDGVLAEPGILVPIGRGISSKSAFCENIWAPELDKIYIFYLI